MFSFLFRGLAWLPLPVLHGFGWLLGWLGFVFSPKYRRRLLGNIRQANMSLGTALASVGESGKMAAETPRLWLGAPVPVEWVGIERVEAALSEGSGVLMFTPHLGCFEVIGQAFALRFGHQVTLTALYRPSRQAWLQDIMAGARNRPGLLMAPTTLAGVKQLIKALKAKQVVGLLPDQVPPEGQGVWAPFFGRDAYTMTLSAKLAQTPGVQLLLLWGERLPWGRGYRIRVRLLSELLPQGLATDANQAAAQLNQVMEALVRESPRQYIWSYDRYKAPKKSDLGEPRTPDKRLR